MSAPNQSVIFSTDDYLLPSSAALPQFHFFFEVIKEGSIIAKIPIKHKQFSLIGRLEDLSDLFVDNPTVSRKHAILQFFSTQSLPSLYDLGSAQGTFVNKQKLPAKAYKKIDLFANVKFGTSSRCYVLRCPELEQKLNEQDEQKENQFIKTITQQNKLLSKKEAKKKYLQLLQNDPYFGGQLKSRKFQGQQNQIKDTQKHYQGITWGIGDENQIYAYRNQKQFPIEPDVLRRLPGLDETMLQKISKFEQNFRIYDEIEAELNELANRQKRQFGLEQKLQNKKEKLQKKFVQSLQALERSQDWIRVNIFGQQNTSNNHKNKQKPKQTDTFSDDQFYDRTLENKHLNKQEKQNGHKKPQNPINQSTVQDLWMLKNLFLSELAKKKQLINHSDNSLTKNCNGTTQNQTILHQQERQKQQEDLLEAFMKDNLDNLNRQNESIYQRQIDFVQSKLTQLKSKLLHFLSVKQVNRLETEVLYPEQMQKRQQKKEKKENEQKHKLQQTLQKLQAEQSARKLKKLKRQQLEQDCQDEYSQKIFDLYREQYREQQHEDQNSQDGIPSRPRPFGSSQINDQSDQRRQGYKRFHGNQNPQQQNQAQDKDQENNHFDSQEKVVDLTKTV